MAAAEEKYLFPERAAKKLEQQIHDSLEELSSVLNYIDTINNGPPKPAKGLSNLGNTCFFNSTMQCLMHTHPLYDWLTKVTEEKQLIIKKGTVVVNEKKVEVPDTEITLKENTQLPLVSALQRFLAEFRVGRNPNSSPLLQQIAVKASRFRGWVQQDAHELLQCLLDGIQTEELQRYKDAIYAYLGVKDKPTPEQIIMCKALIDSTDRCYIDSIFGGSLLQIISCSKCKHMSNSLEPFLDLSLSLPIDYDESVVCVDDLSIIDALEGFIAPELLSNSYECENCCTPGNKENFLANSKDRMTVEATKRYLFYSPPCILTVHLKRFERSFNDDQMRKIDEHVDFPFVLDISHLCSKDGQRINKGQNEVIYSLYGLVSHSGGLKDGHYVAYVKSRNNVESLKQFMKSGMKPDRLCQTMGELNNNNNHPATASVNKEEILQKLDENATWYYVSDSQVRTCSEGDVIKAKAYILFYERAV